MYILIVTYLLVLPGDSFLFNQTLQYTCIRGYNLINNAWIVCQHNGTWNRTYAGCEPVTCPDVLIPDNGYINGTEFHFGRSIQIGCHEGYEVIGVEAVTCNADGEWSGNITGASCEPVTCPDIIIPDNGYVNETRFKFGKYVKFTCHEGYSLDSENVITCLPSGFWNRIEPQCVAVSCGIPAEIGHGSRTFTDTVFKSTTWYDCHIGYRLIGVGEQQCLANGNWSGDIPTCTRVSCGIPEIIHNGSIAQHEVFYEDLVRYACDEGFVLLGQAERSCRSDGTLSNVKPHCQIISCGTPPYIQNGIANYTTDTYTSVAAYFCNDGYEIIDNSEISCLSTGEWSSPIPRCEPVTCGIPDDIENGWFELQNDSFSFNSLLLYQCDVGYDMIGSVSRTCLATGQWSSTAPVCQLVSCDTPPDLLNGYVNTNGITYKSHATYKCNLGYHMTGVAAVRTCLTNGTWSSSPHTCQPVSCGKPQDVTHGSYRGEEWTYRSVVQYSCYAGYELFGSSGVVCHAHATWLPDPPKCNPVECPRPVELVNGHVLKLNGTLQYQSVIQYVCDSGYEIDGDEAQVCSEDSTWSSDAPNCLPVSCGEPPKLLHGFLQGPSNMTFGSVIRYHCQLGYELINSEQIICKADKAWSKPFPRCEPITCEYPDTPSDGNVHINGISFKNEVRYACSEGFRLSGHEIRTCLPDQTWSGQTPRCEPVVCETPPEIEHSTWSRDTNDVSKGFVYGMIIQYTCDKGYVLSSDNMAICGSDGTWNMTSYTICQIVVCQVPDLIPNGQWNATGFEYRSIITYQCNRGYEIIGSSRATCNGNGHWSKAPPTCQLVTCPILDAPINGMMSGGYRYNDILTFGCHDTYELRGSDQLTCTENGTWDHPAPICQHESCGRPPDLPNGVMFGHRFMRGDMVRYRCYSGYVMEGPRSRLCLADNTWSGNPPKCVGE